jgi:uncharacterized protein
MIGTWINIAAVMVGGGLGLLLGGQLPEKIRNSVTTGLGLFTLGLGVKLFLESNQPLIVLGGLLIGVFLGEWWRIEDGLVRLGKSLEARFSKGGNENGESNRFVRGFLTASLLFCIGPLAALGSIQAGLSGDIQLLVIKSVMDAFASLALASSLGVGVLFSTLMVLVYQGGITLLAEQAQGVMTEAMIAELSAVGGILLLGLAISSLLEIRKIRVANFLPALLVVPLIFWVASQFGF